MVSKLSKLAVLPPSLALTSYVLYAVSDREPKGCGVSPHQLSVYSVPPRSSTFIEEEPGHLQRSISAVRTTFSPAVTWGKKAGEAVSNGVVETIQFAEDSYIYLKKPPPEFLPRVGVITVSGLAGLILARRGSRLKKVVYPVGLTALGVSVCYPAQAVIFAKVTGNKLYNAAHWTYDSVSSLWKTERKKESKLAVGEQEEKHPTSEEKPSQTEALTGEPIRTEHTESPEPAQTPNPPESDTASVPPAAVKQSVFIAPVGLTDHGQSNPEDVDMYSTRS